jgi:hypothetical protein
MVTDEDLKVTPEEVRRTHRATLFYRSLVSRVIELGEIARMEIEIQHRFPHAASPPRCPCWHNHSSSHGPAAGPL